MSPLRQRFANWIGSASEPQRNRCRIRGTLIHCRVPRLATAISAFATARLLSARTDGETAVERPAADVRSKPPGDGDAQTRRAS